MGDNEIDDEIAAEHWDDDGGRSATTTRKEAARTDRWKQATNEHWHGYTPTAEKQARREKEIERDTHAARNREPQNDAADATVTP